MSGLPEYVNGTVEFDNDEVEVVTVSFDVRAIFGDLANGSSMEEVTATIAAGVIEECLAAMSMPSTLVH